MVDGEQGQLEAVLVGQLLERRVGFLAVGAVVEDMGDLLALQLVHPAFLLTDIPDDGGGLAPVGGREVEHPREDPAVGRVGAAVAHRMEDRTSTRLTSSN